MRNGATRTQQAYQSDYTQRGAHRGIILLTLASLIQLGCEASGPSVNPQPQTHDFVFSKILFDAADDSDASGFNLDGRFSDETDAVGCHKRDRRSAFDSDQDSCADLAGTCLGGVDNDLPSLVALLDDELTGLGTSITRRLALELQTGSLVFVLRLGGVEDWQNDDAVDVTLARAYPAPQSCGNLFGGRGAFQLAPDWMSSTGTPAIHARGAIAGGRLAVRFDANPAVPYPVVAFPVRDLRLRATFAPDGRAGRMGNFGGMIRIDRLESVIVGEYPNFQSLTQSLVPWVADLPDPVSDQCGTFYQSAGAMGLGVRFELMPAIILGVAPAYRNCGDWWCSQHPDPTDPFHCN